MKIMSESEQWAGSRPPHAVLPNNYNSRVMPRKKKQK